MNLQDLMTKLKSIDENAPPVAPVHTDETPTEECGMPIAIGGAPKQQDNVTMNVSMNGSGAGGISDLMKILRNIEQSDNLDPHHHDVSKMFAQPGHAEPLMGQEEEMAETIDDDEESWGNSVSGASGHHTHGVDAVTFSGDDMNSKGKSSPLQRAPGTNTLREPTNVSEALVNRLTSMYETIKGESIAEAGDKKTMSRAAKGHEKFGPEGMKKLAQAGEDGASEKEMDAIRNKYNKYDESINEWSIGTDTPSDTDDLTWASASQKPELQAIIKQMKPSDYIEYNAFNAHYPDDKSFDDNNPSYQKGLRINLAVHYKFNDQFNFINRWNRDHNNLTVGQWLDKAKNKIISKFTGKPEEKVPYDAYRYDQKTGQGSNIHSTQEKDFPTMTNENADLTAMLKIAGLR